MSLVVKSISPGADQTALEKLRSSRSDDPETEKVRLRKAAGEFESFFLYQMLKTMRQTIPENPLTEDTPMSGGMGKDAYTDIFDMEVARKVSTGGQNSIAGLLYNSLEKLIDAKYADGEDSKELESLRSTASEPLPLDDTSQQPIQSPDSDPIPIEREPSALPVQSAPRKVTTDHIISRYGEYIEEAARETELDSTLIASVIRVESDGDPGAVSDAGAKGLMQLMDSTAHELEVSDVFDPRENIRAGSRYLKRLLDRYGDLELALAAYNAGPGNVDKYGGVPPFTETHQYLERVNRQVSEAKGVSIAKDRK